MGGPAERRILQDEREVAHEAAEFVVWLAEQTLTTGRTFRVALSGGSTPKLLYEALARPDFRKHVDWPSVEFYFGDERCVPPTDADSNFRMAEQALFRPLAIRSDRVFRMPGEADDLAEAARRYEALIRERFHAPAPAWPRFDLILLGLGDDGHTASLFPHTPALQEAARAVLATQSPKGAPNRLTFTLPLINQAATVVFVVTGTGKAAVVKAVLENLDMDAAHYPAKLVRPVHGRLIWFLDRGAGSELAPEKQLMTYEEE
ncbi:MAG: 6-phosphogluconolactonase [Nitrospiraceae bacterium]